MFTLALLLASGQPVFLSDTFGPPRGRPLERQRHGHRAHLLKPDGDSTREAERSGAAPSNSISVRFSSFSSRISNGDNTRYVSHPRTSQQAALQADGELQLIPTQSCLCDFLALECRKSAQAQSHARTVDQALLRARQVLFRQRSCSWGCPCPGRATSAPRSRTECASKRRRRTTSCRT